MSSDAESLLMQGHQTRREHRLNDAKRIFFEAVEAARLSKDRPWLARSYTELGRIERDLRETASAIKNYEAAAALYRKLDDPLQLAHTIRHVGDMLRESGQEQLAEERYGEALKIYRETSETPPLDLANALRGYALLLEAMSRTQEAVALWREARQLYATAPVQAGVEEGDRRIERLSCVA